MPLLLGVQGCMEILRQGTRAPILLLEALPHLLKALTEFWDLDNAGRHITHLQRRANGRHGRHPGRPLCRLRAVRCGRKAAPASTQRQ